jgi:hypothetical protein
MRFWAPIGLGIITAIAIIVTALLTKGTEHENAWLYILGVYAILSAALEIYLSRRK